MNQESDGASVRYQRRQKRSLVRFGRCWSLDGGVGGYRMEGGGGRRGAGMNSNVKQKHRVTNGVYSRRHCFKWLSDAWNLSRFATWQAPLNLFIHPRRRGPHSRNPAEACGFTVFYRWERTVEQLLAIHINDRAPWMPSTLCLHYHLRA